MKERKGLKDLEGLEVKCQKIRNNTPRAFKVINEWDRLEPLDGILYWHIHNFSPDLSQEDLIGALRLGFENWNDAFDKGSIDLKMESTSNPNKAQIHCYFAENGDSNLPYAFEQGVLAYALNDGRIFFNDDWNWTLALDPKGIKFVDVHTHEIGHEHLLDHSPAPKEIMQAYYDATGENHITQDSINGLREVYAEFIIEETEPTTPTENNLYQNAYQALTRADKFKKLTKRTFLSITQGLADENEPFKAALVNWVKSGIKEVTKLSEDDLMGILIDLGEEPNIDDIKDRHFLNIAYALGLDTDDL